MSPNDADGMANSVDPDQAASLIWVCTVCPDLSVRKLRKITVRFTESLVQVKRKVTGIFRPLVIGLDFHKKDFISISASIKIHSKI